MARAKINGRKASWDGGEATFDWKAFDKIRRSPELVKLLEQIGEGIASEAEQYPEHSEPDYDNRKKYVSKVEAGKHTTTGIVAPASPHAANSNAKHNTLVKLIGRGGRG